jgi:outer membrane protein assembly factor BamB
MKQRSPHSRRRLDPRCCLAVCLLMAPAATAADWTQFGRDQTRNPVSVEKNPPLWWRFEESDGKSRKNIRWSADTAGGYAATGEPIVIDGLIWISTSTVPGDGDDRAMLVCLEEKTGKILYRYYSARLEEGRGQDVPRTGMNCAPLVAGDWLWFTSNRCEVVCLDIGPLRTRTGQPVVRWTLDMRKTLGVVPNGNDFVALRRCSIAGFKDFLYVTTGNGRRWSGEKLPAPAAPSLVCLDKRTGKVVWTDNSPGENVILGQPSSPLVVEINGRAQVIVGQGDGWLRSFDALGGKRLWEFDTNPPDAVIDKHLPRGTRNWLLATPVYHDGRIYIGNGQNGEHEGGPAWLYCIDPTKTGNISPELPSGPREGKPNPNSGMIWRYGGKEKDGKSDGFCRTLSNVAVTQGLVIAPCIDGRVHCLDAKTGTRHWVVDTDYLVASPLIVDDVVYIGTVYGGIWVLNLSKELKVLGKIEAPSALRYNPVFANGALYLQAGRLYAITGNESDAPRR